MIRSNNKQSGMTIFSFIVVLLVVGFFVYMAVRLVPPYIDFMGVTKAMETQASEGANGQSQSEIRRAFEFRLYNQSVDDIFKSDAIKFEKTDDGRVKLHVEYDQRVHFLYNIDFLLHFDNSVYLKGATGY